MKTRHLVDPEYLAHTESSSDDCWTRETLPGIRERIKRSYKTQEAMHGETVVVPSTEPDVTVRLCIYRPESSAAFERPAILYLHGGGFIVGSTAMVDDYLAELARALDAVIISVDYRLAPETPFPGPLEDSYSGLRWLFEQAQALQVDTSRVVLMGHSAGGGLAAALALLARDRGEYPLAGQVLIYPMLDYRTGTPEAPVQNLSTGEFYWSAENNRFAWNCMQGSFDLNPERVGYFSPALADDLSNLPATFMAVGALDLFLEEDVNYALRLSRLGVPLELHVYPGVFHGFDRLPGQRSETCCADILAALRRLLGVSSQKHTLLPSQAPQTYKRG